MAELGDPLSEKLKALGGNWTVYSAVGSFALYLLGYLALRFHLTAIGIGTDLAVLDERYLFAGAKFLVYLVSSVPIAVLLVLVLVVLAYLPYRILPGSVRAKIGERISGHWEKLRVWWSVPHRLALTGIVFSVGLIQFIMRKCFFLSNVLLAPHFPGPGWLRALLLTQGEGLMSLYFAGLVAGTAVAGGLCWCAWRREGHTTLSHLLVGLLAFLVAVQFLMLPVNYGILIADKTMPRVAHLGGQKALDKGQQAWLVWKGKEGVTYLVRDGEGDKRKRKLVTIPHKDVKKIEIIAYDPILRALFVKKQGAATPKQEEKRRAP